MTGDQSGDQTYRPECHFDDCDVRFLAIDKDDYIQHLREAHGELQADLWDRLVIQK